MYIPHCVTGITVCLRTYLTVLLVQRCLCTCLTMWLV